MIGVLGIPFDSNSSFLKGPARAPQKIREAFHSDSTNYYSESGIDFGNEDHWKDFGDIEFANDAEFFDRIKSEVTQLLADEKKLLLLGGDHSITYPIVKAFSMRYHPLTILHIDAHSDLYENFQNNRYSHASPFARIMEEGLANRLVQVGIRTLNKHQLSQANRFGVEIVTMKDYDEDYDFHFEGPVYLSLDLDALDPAFMPGVSHHEPGGFSTRQMVRLLQRVQGNFIGADLVELNPDRDASGMSNAVAGKIFKEILDLLLRS